MVSRVALGMYLTVGNLAWSACSSSHESCPAVCELVTMTGPRIEVAPGDPSIAAIETLSSPLAFAGYVVGWGLYSSVPATAQSICPAEVVDAGWETEGCAERYPCTPDNTPSGNSACTVAWIDMQAEHCLVTVISTTGERQSFEVMQSRPAVYSRCHTEDGTCVSSGGPSVWPMAITVSFAPVDAGPNESDGAGSVD